mmetsp:Transcript_4497/g.10971  ORF Transcript_4497/g.10971 Transcript_4497/m.10971 type:complete len:123 (+) Transcript_4497:1327-1695(+)
MSSNSNVSQMAINTLHSVAQRRAESLPKVIDIIRSLLDKSKHASLPPTSLDIYDRFMSQNHDDVADSLEEDEKSLRILENKKKTASSARDKQQLQAEEDRIRSRLDVRRKELEVRDEETRVF